MYQTSLKLLSLFHQSECEKTLIEEKTRNKVEDITRQILEQIGKAPFPKNICEFIETFAYVYSEWGKKSLDPSHINFFITQITCIQETFTIHFPKTDLFKLKRAILEMQDPQKIKN